MLDSGGCEGTEVGCDDTGTQTVIHIPLHGR